MALNRKYAALPDLDSAPDIYETPELTDDNSTVPPTTVRSQSEDEYDDDADEDATGISRTRLRIDQARSRFLPSGVDAGSVDFSDRVDGKRKSYKTSTRRHRILEDGTEELGDLSGDDDAESLERKIARLKRELTEVKEEHSRLAAASQTTAPLAKQQERQLSSLSEALDEISRPLNIAHRATTEPHVPMRVSHTASSTQGQWGDGSDSLAATYTITYAPNYEQSHTLAKTADFDQRLSALEKAIGIASTAVPGVDATGLPRAILPNLEALQRQLSTFSQAATSNFDTASRRIRNLVQEAEKLEKARANAKAAQEALGQAAVGAKGGDDAEQVAKINALYGTLPTIESLAPLLPPLLDRLRSLRVIHGEASAASETMSRIEQQQSEMAAEIKQWREGLEKVEAAMKAGDETMVGNQKVMETWVKQLEQRIAKLA